MPVPGGIPTPVGSFPGWLQTNLPAASSIPTAPTVGGGAALGGGATAITGATPAGTAIATAPGGVAALGVLAFGGGFLAGDTVIRPLLGIEYPGGGGLQDWLARDRPGNRSNRGDDPSGGLITPTFPGAGELTGGQSPGVVYDVTGSATRTTPSGGTDTLEINNFGVGPFRVSRTEDGGVNAARIIDANGKSVFNINAVPGETITLSPNFTRRDGEVDSYGSPRVGGSPASVANPPTLSPATAPYGSPSPQRSAPPATVPTSPPNSTPSTNPNRTNDPAPSEPERPRIPGGLPAWLAGLGALGVGIGLTGARLGGASLQNPLTQNAGARTPPTQPPQAPPSGNCGCNAGVLSGVRNLLGQQTAALTAQGAGTAGILAKLNQMQNFAEAAWKNTHLDKAINAITLLGVLHNAYYISTDLAFTFGEFVSLGLSAVGVKDEEGNALDINSLVRNQVQNIINNLIGEEQALAISQRLSRFGRIFRAGTNIIWTLRNIQDTTADVLELTANNTGKIGNALKRSGVVDRLSYPWMPTNVQASDLWRRKFQRVFDGLEQAEDTLGAAYGVTANVLELGEEVNFLSQQKQQFIDEVTTGEDVPGLENQTIADTETLVTQESVSPDLDGVSLDNANTITP